MAALWEGVSPTARGDKSLNEEEEEKQLSQLQFLLCFSPRSLLPGGAGSKSLALNSSLAGARPACPHPTHSPPKTRVSALPSPQPASASRPWR